MFQSYLCFQGLQSRGGQIVDAIFLEVPQPKAYEQAKPSRRGAVAAVYKEIKAGVLPEVLG